MGEFLKFVIYSVIGAIIFLGIYSIWFNPGGVTRTFEVIKDKITSQVIEDKNTGFNGEPTNNNQTNFIEYSNPIFPPPSCALIELGARSEDINIKEAKEIECRVKCGFDNKEFHHFECVTDKLHCFCELS